MLARDNHYQLVEQRDEQSCDSFQRFIGLAISNCQALTVSGDVDVPRRDVDVHQVVDDPGLDVALVLVNQNL